MELYTSGEADLLIKFYTEVAIGRPIKTGSESKIIKIRKDLAGDRYRVNAISVLNGVSFKRSIATVAKELNIQLPNYVLNGHSQS